ncbi:MAG: hypothetical protein FWG64_13895 [Firmicutes bacterium]|nr:hypothetical protein [Bacillota bacterium]
MQICAIIKEQSRVFCYTQSRDNLNSAFLSTLKIKISYNNLVDILLATQKILSAYFCVQKTVQII